MRFLIFLLPFLVFTACKRDDSEPVPEEKVIPPAEPELSELKAQEYTADILSEITVEVTLVSENGSPIADAIINASVPLGNAAFVTEKATTDETGKAIFRLNCGDDFSSSLAFSFEGNKAYQPSDVRTVLFTNYKYRVPGSIDDMPVGDIRDWNKDLSKLEELIDKIRNWETGYRYLNTMAVQIDGKLVLEEYFDYKPKGQNFGLERDDNLYYIASVSKSITSAGIGAVYDQGLLELDDKVLSYYEGEEFDNTDDRKREMTVQNLLDMLSGLECEDGGWWGYDYIDYHMNLPMANTPGKSFRYCSGTTMILCDLIRKTSTQDAKDFTFTYLFDKMGIKEEDTEWEYDNYGNLGCGYGLWMKLRDMIKFGQLYVNEGQWNGEQLLSKEWIEHSFKPRVEQGFTDYGNQWWHATYNNINGKSIEVHHAIGNGASYITVVPDLDMVVVIQGNDFNVPNLEPALMHNTYEHEILKKILLPMFSE